MKTDSHYAVTAAAFDVVRSIRPTLPILTSQTIVAQTAHDTDDRDDMEFVDVEGIPGTGTGVDNPHADDFWVLGPAEDEARTKPWGYSVTCFNDFIDIGKGPGTFDDYDGYSYKKRVAPLAEHQTGRIG